MQYKHLLLILFLAVVILQIASATGQVAPNNTNLNSSNVTNISGNIASGNYTFINQVGHTVRCVNGVCEELDENLKFPMLQIEFSAVIAAFIIVLIGITWLALTKEF